MLAPNGQLVSSRYAQTEVALYVASDGRTIPYLTVRRPLIAPLQSTHAVVGGDRLDLIAHAVYGDPTQFWRIADAEGAMWPDDLTAEIGRRLRIPSAFGVQR